MFSLRKKIGLKEYTTDELLDEMKSREEEIVAKSISEINKNIKTLKKLGYTIRKEGFDEQSYVSKLYTNYDKQKKIIKYEPIKY